MKHEFFTSWGFWRFMGIVIAAAVCAIFLQFGDLPSAGWIVLICLPLTFTGWGLAVCLLSSRYCSQCGSCYDEALRQARHENQSSTDREP